jgi:hypothetical protein
MAAATYDIQNIVGKNRPQSSRRCEIPLRIDFSDINGGSGLAAGESVAVGETPKGFVYQGCDGFLVGAEGAAGNFDFGTEADVDGMLDGGNANGTAGAAIAKAGTESQAAGSYLSETELRVSVAAAQPTLDAAVAYLVVHGYIIDLPAA